MYHVSPPRQFATPETQAFLRPWLCVRPEKCDRDIVYRDIVYRDIVYRDIVYRDIVYRDIVPNICMIQR